MPKEGDVAYNQQCDTILKLKNLRLQALSITLEDKTFLQRIFENLVNDSLVTGVRSHGKNPPSDFDKFKFCDGLLYHDELLYMYRKALHDFKFSKPNTTHWLLAILDSTRPWS
jgi:hypothetical protein